MHVTKMQNVKDKLMVNAAGQKQQNLKLV